LAETEVGGGETTAATPSAPEPAPPPAPAGPRRRWLAIGAIVVVLLLLIAYVVVGAAAASASSGGADRALKTTISHQDTVDATLSEDPFKGIDLSSANADVSAAKTALANFEPKFAQVKALVKADRAALLQARPGLQGSALTLPEQGILSGDQRRIDAALSALQSADQVLVYNQQEIDFLHPFLDAYTSLQALAKKEQAVDLPGSLSELTTTEADLQKTIAFAKPPAIPSSLVTALNDLKTLLADIRSALEAAQAHNLPAFQKASAALDADDKKLSSFDATATENAIKALFKPLSDRYVSQLKIAAGQ